MFRAATCVALFLAALTLNADTNCACDASQPETLKARQCSLCAEAEKQPPEQVVFFLKDANPRKPNRLLALPRAHAPGQHRMADLPAEVQTALWTAAVAKAQELFPQGDWGIAFNGDHVRTQCHTHVHIGHLLPGIETSNFIVVDNAAAIPPPPDANGYWIHPAEGGKLHIHRGEQITETVLLR
jgi:diadenosine tetraphosphate (Ap4A) HIT family hydrolase